jgi:hypothetical protein
MHRAVFAPLAVVIGSSALLLPACGSSSPSSPAAPAQLQIAGAYQITPTLLQDGCGGTSVSPGPAQVTHTAGASQFQLSHAGITYAGRVDAAGGFSTDPVSVTLSAGTSVSVRVEGRFSTGGFDATVTVDESRLGATAACRYVVRWQASKQGAPNVLPG